MRIHSLLFLFLAGILSAGAQPTVSFTFDDGITNNMPGYAFVEWNSMILEHLDKAGVRAVFFVTGNNKSDEKGKWFREFYLKHLYERAMYYEDLSYKLTGRHISHTLLLHHNLTSALFLGDLIAMFMEKGWVIIDAEDAYRDKIFTKQPTNIPAGEGLIWALARASGNFDELLRYPAEDSRYEQDEMDRLGL